MPSHYHAVVWIDHTQARIFHVGLSGEDEMILHPHMPTQHLHHKANSIGSGHVTFDKAFLDSVTNAIADAGEILITGPGTARTELATHIRKHEPKIGERIVAVEPSDHPTDGEIIAHAKKYFRIAPARITAKR